MCYDYFFWRLSASPQRGLCQERELIRMFTCEFHPFSHLRCIERKSLCGKAKWGRGSKPLANRVTTWCFWKRAYSIVISFPADLSLGVPPTPSLTRPPQRPLRGRGLPAGPPCWACCSAASSPRGTRPRSAGAAASRTRCWWRRRSRCGRPRSCEGRS